MSDWGNVGMSSGDRMRDGVRPGTVGRRTDGCVVDYRMSIGGRMSVDGRAMDD